jgi:hypothetical protein
VAPEDPDWWGFCGGRRPRISRRFRGRRLCGLPPPWTRFREPSHPRTALGRPLVSSIANSSVHNLKELRPGSTGRTEVRILFAFDPWRSAILLTGGDKSGDWQGWYRRAIPHAEQLYEEYLKERDAETEEGR